MNNKKPLIISLCFFGIIALAVPVLNKYFELEDEKCIKFVKEMQYPGYGNVTLDQALRNLGGTPYYFSDGEKVWVEMSSPPLTMVFMVDMKNDMEYLYYCSLDGNSLGEHEALELLREIYENSY